MIYNKYKKHVNEQKARREVYQNMLIEKETKLKFLKDRVDHIAKAKWVISEVVSLTQQSVKEYIEGLVTMGLNSVFDRDYKFTVDFDMRDNASNCLLRVQEGDWEPYVPKDDQGGGILDVLSFCLRVVLWSLEYPKSRSFFYLDEPMKFVGNGDSEEVKRAVDMIKEVSRRLEFQLVINTHEPMIASIGDKVFQVTHKDRKSIVTSIGPEGKVEDRGEELEGPKKKKWKPLK